MKKYLLVLVMVMCVTMLLIGCSTQTPAPAQAPAPTTQAPAPTTQAKTTAAPAAGDSTKVYELSFSDYQGPELAQAKWIDGWAKKMEADSNGRLKIRVYHSGSLLPSNNTWPGVVKGLADFGTSFRWETHGKVFQDYIGQFMAGVTSGEMSQKVWDDCYEKFPEFREEWKDNKLMFIASPPVFGVHNSKRPLHTPDDLKGLQIRVMSQATGDVVKAMGGTPVLAPITEAYEMLQKGTVQGIHCGIDALKLFRFGEVLQYTTWTNESSPVGYFQCMNWDTYNSLPADLQKLIDDSIPQAKKEMQIIMDEQGEAAKEYLKGLNKGYEFYTPTAAEYEQWYAPLAPLREKMAADIDAKGYPGTEVHKYAQERTKYYLGQAK